MIYPSLPYDAARLRFFMTSLHTEEQIKFTLNTLMEIMEESSISNVLYKIFFIIHIVVCWFDKITYITFFNTMSYNITRHFFNYFSLSIADTPELKQEVYKIRYQVYCEELEYESKEEFIDGMEKDIYDSRSIHCLLKHKISDRYIGCVRLVLPTSELLNDRFPLEEIFNHDFQVTETVSYNYAEISRLAIIKDFRQRQGEDNSSVGLLFSDNEPDSLSIPTERRVYPLTSLSLYLACISLLLSLNINNGLTVMEAKLSRQLRLCGIPSCLIGDFVNFHGKQAPFLLSPTKIVSNMDREIATLFNTLHSQLQPKIDKHPLKRKYQEPILSK